MNLFRPKNTIFSTQKSLYWPVHHVIFTMPYNAGNYRQCRKDGAGVKNLLPCMFRFDVLIFFRIFSKPKNHDDPGA